MSAVYGCHNREPLRDTAVAQDGWHPVNWHDTKARREITIPAPMSKDCKYTHSEQGRTDPKCQGCKHRAEQPGTTS